MRVNLYSPTRTQSEECKYVSPPKSRHCMVAVRFEPQTIFMSRVTTTWTDSIYRPLFAGEVNEIDIQMFPNSLFHWQSIISHPYINLNSFLLSISLSIDYIFLIHSKCNLIINKPYNC